MKPAYLNEKLTLTGAELVDYETRLADAREAVEKAREDFNCAARVEKEGKKAQLLDASRKLGKILKELD